ncbi:MAG: taurine ABC transporter substrate-binding protein [Pseudomonadota bacterium]
MRKILVTAAAITGLFAGVANAAEVKIGFQLTYTPVKAQFEAIKNGALGKSVEFIQFNSGGDVINAMASGSIDFSLNGSSPSAAGYSRGVDLQVVYIYDNINDAEALVVRDGSGIVAPQDLKGKKIAVPFGSTTHFHMMFALEQFGINPRDLDVLDMSPPDLAAAWERGDIDGAFVWDPALGKIKKNGHVLLSSGDLSNWGKATFDALVARSEFAKANPDVMCKFIKIVAAADEDYRSNPASYGPGTDKAKAIAKVVGGDHEQVGGVLALYDFPTLDQQISATWLGGGVASALRATSEFLKDQGKIDKVLDSYDGAADATYAKMARDGKC